MEKELEKILIQALKKEIGKAIVEGIKLVIVIAMFFLGIVFVKGYIYLWNLSLASKIILIVLSLGLVLKEFFE
jgi:hypothetical protein